MAPLKVHGSPMSTATQRVLVCLYEKDLDFEFVPVNMGTGDHKKEPFISRNPFGQVPAFEDGDLTLFESRAITQYIAHTNADKGTQLLIMEDPIPKKMAIMSVWMEVEAHQFDRSTSKLAWEVVFKPMFGMTTDTAAVSEEEAKLNKILDVYEARLAQSKYIGGDSFSLADMHHLPNLGYLMETPYKSYFESRPHVSAWCKDILARPAWAKVKAMKA
uniref:glutathione transferase n=1 Tax=Cyclamen persicum x Cyclamen purpurascens TaxID=993404 RepID=I2FHU7_9ERIC|nr:putative glutathione S-transferase [Cyclamen persicum x Cyclamen purpurascens]